MKGERVSVVERDILVRGESAEAAVEFVVGKFANSCTGEEGKI